MIKLPLYPAHPERVCWGCDRYCPAHDLACGNGSERTLHPQELFGDDWVESAAERLGDSLELTTHDISALPAHSAGRAVSSSAGTCSVGPRR
jgi:hypothetical protein